MSWLMLHASALQPWRLPLQAQRRVHRSQPVRCTEPAGDNANMRWILDRYDKMVETRRDETTNAGLNPKLALHQSTNGYDFYDQVTWNKYVSQVMIDIPSRALGPRVGLHTGDSVFEAGCGGGRFLEACAMCTSTPLLVGGVDGSNECVHLAWEVIAEDAAAAKVLDSRPKFDPRSGDHVSLGVFPSALEGVPTDSWDMVVSNGCSIFLGEEDNERTTREMLRIARRLVVISDVVDADRVGEAVGWPLKPYGAGQQTETHAFLSYPTGWWQQRFGDEHRVHIAKHEDVFALSLPEYNAHYDQALRYVVYIEKGGGPSGDSQARTLERERERSEELDVERKRERERERERDQARQRDMERAADRQREWEQRQRED